jgi:polyisoprenoid-binding protein YceI
MKSIIVLLALLVGAITANAQEHVRFTIKNAGMSIEGSFTNFKSALSYDKADPANSSFSTEIQVKSINTGITMRDNHLKKADFFDLDKYPTIKFASTSVVAAGANTLKVSGNLTIKNVTKPVVLTVKVSEKDGKTTFSATTTLNRNTYGVGGSSWTMADDLTVNIKAVK